MTSSGVIFLLTPQTSMFFFLLYLTLAQAAVQRKVVTHSGKYVLLEFLDDDLIHLETASGTAPSTSNPLWTSSMVSKTDYSGPSSFNEISSTVFQTADLEVSVHSTTLEVTFNDLTGASAVTLTKVKPINLDQAWKGFDLTKEGTLYLYGLGQQFKTVGSADGDWTGHQRSPGETHGNAMVSFDGGAVGNTQFPILYSKGSSADYALFLDQIYKSEWTFTSGSGPWPVRMWGDQVRYYFLSGADLQDLRQDYLELSGRPPVPPKMIFGLWLSEYGYESWTEVDDALEKINDYNFPVDGIVLDLFWFGGVTECSDDSQMGTLTWDTSNFPNPATKISSLRNTDGVGVMLIEESYISKNLQEHTDLDDFEYLAYQDQYKTNPVYLTSNCWWGKGSMIDWTNEEAGDYWHDEKRRDLIDDGVTAHWTDLGEPEMYDGNAYYVGFDPVNFPTKTRQADVHNIYNLRWLESIIRGYERNNITLRPFLMSRSGTAGMQRLGASLWSGDIGSRLSSLATHLNAQLHLSFSGLDYYGSDIGGFHRSAFDSDPASGKTLDEMYTQWLANSAWLDVPVRPHTENLCNCKETNPTEIGHRETNLENLRQRYELTPYYYSLAYRAWLVGEPLAPPLIYYHESEHSQVGEMGHEKLLGRDLLIAIVAGYDELYRDVYLPAGDWIDYRSREWQKGSSGRWIDDLPEYLNNRFKLPVFVKAGAILPKMWVDHQTINVLGKRRDSSTRNDLIVEAYFIYPLPGTHQFTLYEDDGTSISYQSGSYRTTLLKLEAPSSTSAKVTIKTASGSYSGAPSSRDMRARLITDHKQASAVTSNGNSLTQYTSLSNFEAASSGWINAERNLVLAKVSSSSVSSDRDFTFTLTGATAKSSAYFVAGNGYTRFGCSLYVVGSISELGNWNPCSAVKMDTMVGLGGQSFYYPSWTRWIQELPVSTNIQWKFIRREEGNCQVVDWMSGNNQQFTTGSSGGFAGTFDVTPSWGSNNCV